ncbi:FUSC family protein [Terrisporobacter sp.]
MYKKIIKQSFKLNKVPVSLERMICAAICSGLPIILGFLFNQPKYGMWGSLGGFTYMYVFNEPYAQRLKKMFLLAISVTICATLGIVLSPHPWLIILAAGLIGGVSVFAFGALKIPGPSAIFLIMIFTMTSGIPINKGDIPIFTFIVLISSLFSVMVSMIGYFFNPHGPEIKKVNKLYFDLLQLAKGIGEGNLSKLRSNAVNSLKETEAILRTGYNRKKVSFTFERLYLLSQCANKMFLEMLDFNHDNRLPEEVIAVMEDLQSQIDLQFEKKITLKKINKGIYKEYDELLETIYEVEEIMNMPLEGLESRVEICKPSLNTLMRESIDKDSIVLVNAIRYGIVLMFSALVAYELKIPKSSWITLSCAAVMSGSTVMSTFYRSIQRFVGTILGVVIVMCIYYMNPHSYSIALFNMALTMLTEFFIAKNYAIGAMFFTANAILIAEASSGIYTLSNLVSARIISIVIGCVIGFLGTYLMGRKSASSRLKELMAKTLHSQSKVIFALSRSGKRKNLRILKEKMEIDFNNLMLAYNTALGESHKNKEIIESMWLSIYSLEQINYLLVQYCMSKEEINIPIEQLKKILFIYESMENNIELDIKMEYADIDIYSSIELLCKEINVLQRHIVV